MQYYQHEFENIEDYLHHRPPYLLVESIVSISAAEIVTQKLVSGDEFFIKGHFPGAPIFPGAMMQRQETYNFLRIWPSKGRFECDSKKAWVFEEAG